MVDKGDRPNENGQLTEEKGLLNRRGYLQMAAAAVGTVAGGTALTGQAQAAISRDDIQFDTVVDAVDDLGLDPNEGAVIDDTLSQLDDGTLVKFPTGRYSIDSCVISGSNVGLVAADGADPVFVADSPISQSESYSLIMAQGGDHMLSGIQFDFRGDGYGGLIYVVANTGDLYISDVQILGVVPDDVSGLATGVFDPNGTGVVERFIARDGSKYGTSSHGVLVKDKHAGRLYFRDCEVWNWSDNGLYASSPGYVGDFNGVATSDRGNGEVHVEGGVFKNNNISNVRIGTTNSSVRGAVVRNEENPSGDSWDSREHDIQTHATDVVNSRGIWVRNRNGQVIENCTISMETGVSSGGIVSGANLGTLTVRDTDIAVTTDDVYYPIRMRDTARSDAAVTLDGVTLTGTGGKREAINITGRDGTTVTNCCADLSASSMNGIEFFNSNDTKVSDSNINVSGEAIVYNNSAGTTQNVTYSESCAVSDDDSGSTDTGSTDDESTTTDDGSTTTDEVELSQTMTVRGTGQEVDYTVETTEGIVSGSDGNTVSDPQTTASGTVTADGEAWFWWDAEIVSVSLSADADFYVNGSKVDPDQWTDSDSGSTDSGSTDDGSTTTDDGSTTTDDGSTTTDEVELSQTMTVRGTGQEVDYTVETTEGIVSGSDGNTVSDPPTTASGTVAADGEAWFWWDAEIVSVSLSADADFYVNGSKVDPDSVGLPHALVFGGNDGQSKYYFEVTGDVLKSSALGTVEQDDTITDGTVSGTVREDADGYRFSGELTKLTIKGNASANFQ